MKVSELQIQKEGILPPQGSLVEEELELAWLLLLPTQAFPTTSCRLDAQRALAPRLLPFGV